MNTCTRRIQFCAGHRVMGHENKCRNLHGHNYVAFITAEAALDDLGRVIDFSVLKDIVGGWIDKHWDHGFIVCVQDAQVHRALAMVPGTKAFVMDDNPTAENMSTLLMERANALLASHGIRIVHVRIWETENCYADAR